jgi:hypothetical protein
VVNNNTIGALLAVKRRVEREWNEGQLNTTATTGHHRIFSN